MSHPRPCEGCGRQASVDTWTVAVEVPLSLPADMRHDLFSMIAAAVSRWEPDDRDGWDADVSGYPTADSLRAWEALAAAERVRALATAAQEKAANGPGFMLGGVPFPARVPAADVLAALDQPEATPPAEHTGGNAEDCPACSGRRDLPYPFICPGPEETT
ncbi:hypothetical protein [Actinomadura decatromicini]|uniref:Uncharacterized protein n=1 Tax=Actinomadura decatromicini TaxID=2604572 RepID=A0A5D3FBB8_9ACTN|nr:hypothetical protein [Actinomadura decatromicini]TYK45184.1 hypothetical protein FXF68_31390 [Actinomadura decatromicini]